MDKKFEELLEEVTDNIYIILTDKPLQVLEIFNDFFGESRVDLQGLVSKESIKASIESYFNTFEKLQEASPADILSTLVYDDCSIIIRFPEVRITNEYDKYVDVRNLWAKVTIKQKEGLLAGRFSINRSEYPISHLMGRYMHSHVSSIPFTDLTSFQQPCTGTGPINRTIESLRIEFNSDLWALFCLELDKFMCTESIAGTPYHRLEAIGAGNSRYDNNFVAMFSAGWWPLEIKLLPIKDFIKYFLNKKKLKFSYIENSYKPGISYVEYLILISNEFITWYNDLFNKGKVSVTFNQLVNKELLRKVIIYNNKIFDNNTYTSNMQSYTDLIGKKVLTFKQKDITLTISDIDNSENLNSVILLHENIANTILTLILKYLNCCYGETDTHTGERVL
jgi:hypothetical protein